MKTKILKSIAGSVTAALAIAVYTPMGNAETTPLDPDPNPFSNLTPKEVHALNYGVTSKEEAQRCYDEKHFEGPRLALANIIHCSEIVITQEEYDAAVRKQYSSTEIGASIAFKISKNLNWLASFSS